MGFQNKAGSIILDATLTDVGRRHMANGKFEITKFALGDDEVDYGVGVTSGGEYVIETAPYTLEATTEAAAAVIHGLVDFGNRNDLMYFPEYVLNTKIKNAVTPYVNRIYLSVNNETTKKLSQAIRFDLHILENEKEKSNMILFESGIGQTEETRPIVGTLDSKRRMIYNFKLYDDYAFVYADSRFIKNIMASPMSETSVSLSKTGTEKSTVQPLVTKHSVSIPAPVANYKTYYCKTSHNNIYDEVPDIDSQNHSMFFGPRGCFVGLNLIVNDKMKSKSNGAADVRYTKFGKTSQNLFSDGNLYDYVDTNIMIEGCTSTSTNIVQIRIVRFSGT